MSIENNLKRIADALETIASKLDHIGTAVDEAPKTAPKEESVPASAAATNSTQATTAPTAAVPPAPPVKQDTVAPSTKSATAIPAAPAQESTPAPVSMTSDELNAALVAEFNRIGKREPIDDVLRGFGVQSITALKEDQYTAVINKVKEIKA